MIPLPQFIGLRGGAAWNPANVPGIYAWYRADGDPAGYSDGSLVATWTNRVSPGTRDLVATGTFRPTFKTGIANGKSALLFSGATNNKLNASAFSLSQSFTAFFAVNPQNLATYEFNAFDGTTSRARFAGLTGNPWNIFAGSASVGTVTTSNGNLRGWAVFNGASSSVKVGSTTNTGNPGANALSALICGLRGTGVGTYADGYFYELAFASGVASAADLAAWEAYTASQYGF